MSHWRRQLHDLFCSPGVISRDTQHFLDVIFSPSAGIVLLFDLGKTEAPEGSRVKEMSTGFAVRQLQLGALLGSFLCDPALDSLCFLFCEMGRPTAQSFLD